MNSRTKQLIWARVVNGILTAIAVIFAWVVIVLGLGLELNSTVVMVSLIGVTFLVLLSCASNDRKSIGEILHTQSFPCSMCVGVFAGVGAWVIAIAISYIIIEFFRVSFSFKEYVRLVVYVWLAIVIAAMLYCHIRSACWYISYLKKGPAGIGHPLLSNGGFVCLRDFALLVACSYWLLSYMRLGQEANIAICILIGFYANGNIINLALYFVAREMRDTLQYTWSDEASIIRKPMLITADVWDLVRDEYVFIRFWRFGEIKVFNAEGFFIPEFVVDAFAFFWRENEGHACFFGNYVTIMNAFSYADACRQLLKQDRGKNGILFLSHSHLQPEKLRAMLTPEELEKIGFVTVEYTELVKPVS